MPPLRPPFSDTKFSLNAWGLAGIFGGKEAITAMALIPLYRGRHWLGWYNAPGTLEVARHFDRLANFQNHDPRDSSTARLFGLDGQVGPRFTSPFAGAEVPTGHLGYLVMERCKRVSKSMKIIEGRVTIPTHVVLINLGEVDHDHGVPHLSKIDVLLALIPVITSIVTCVMCALVHDWYSFSTILVGIFAGGFAAISIGGSVQPVLQHVKYPAMYSPPGDGVLVPVTREDIVVVVKGSGAAVDLITKGKFGLELGGRVPQHAMVVSTILLILATMTQLLLIPQGTFFGQLMFVISLCVSWGHNFRLSLLNREGLQTDMLLQKLGDPQIRKFLLGARTTMAVFVALLVFHGISKPGRPKVEKTLRILLPDDTIVWEKWRKKVARGVCDKSLSCLRVDEKDDDLREHETHLLRLLLSDASSAFKGYWDTYPFNKKLS